MKIVGYTVGTPLPKPNFDQTDPKKGDYIKGDRSFLNVDNTLTNAGSPADAKATGDAISSIQAEIDEQLQEITIEYIDTLCANTLPEESLTESQVTELFNKISGPAVNAEEVEF